MTRRPVGHTVRVFCAAAAGLGLWQVGWIADQSSRLGEFLPAPWSPTFWIAAWSFVAVAGAVAAVTGADVARNHPCRAGERLRLPAADVEFFRPGTPERVVADALHRFGAIVGDRSDHSGSATSKPGRLSCTQDPRINTGWKGLGLRLSDLEVIHQP